MRLEPVTSDLVDLHKLMYKRDPSLDMTQIHYAAC